MDPEVVGWQGADELLGEVIGVEDDRPSRLGDTGDTGTLGRVQVCESDEAQLN